MLPSVRGMVVDVVEVKRRVFVWGLLFVVLSDNVLDFECPRMELDCLSCCWLDDILMIVAIDDDSLIVNIACVV